MKKGFLFSLITSGILLTSFSISTKSPYSEKAAMKQLNKWCSYVPSGQAIVEEDTVNVQAFFMSSTEITNFQYKEFLAYLEKNGDEEKLKVAQIDTMSWNRAFKNASMEPMTSHYHDHPAYREYPVVNVTKAGAELFCEWMTMMYDSISNSELTINFRVPTRAEYMRAARGNNHHRVYAWEGTTLYKRDGKSVFHGMVQANCIINGAECITRNKETGKLEFTPAKYQMEDLYSDGAYLTATAKSYWPNDFGFYNINGNVAEMISDGDFAVGGSWYSPGYDVRNESIESFTEAHPTVGFRVVATYLNPVK